MDIIRTTVRIPIELHELLKEEAQRDRRSVHNLILSILWKYFDVAPRD